MIKVKALLTRIPEHWIDLYFDQNRLIKVKIENFAVADPLKNTVYYFEKGKLLNPSSYANKDSLQHFYKMVADVSLEMAKIFPKRKN